MDQDAFSEKGVGPWAWRLSSSSGNPDVVSRKSLSQDTEKVARDLLGCHLRSSIAGEVVEGVIVETEAYIGPHDPASHAAARIGKTERNSTMFGPPGQAYVYRSYGIHWCLNVVTEREGYPSAVLIRALDPLGGEDAMLARRGGRVPLCSGPGRLTQAFGVSGLLDGHPLQEEPLVLMVGWDVEAGEVCVSERIGVSRGAHLPLRFFLKNHPAVSRKLSGTHGPTKKSRRLRQDD